MTPISKNDRASCLASTEAEVTKGTLRPGNDYFLGKAILNFERILATVQNYQDIEKNVPLIEVAKLEKPFRRLFLDHEYFAAEVHRRLTDYARQYPFILTPHATHILDAIGNPLDTRIYVTELIVPKTGDMGIHITDIDLVSFRGRNGMKETLEFLAAQITSPLSLTKFTKPVHKGDPKRGYWSSESLTKVDMPGKIEITDIKVRKIAA